MIRHVLFDMDGTLSDTASATVHSCAEVARRFGLSPPEENAVRKHMGWAAPEYWRKLWPGINEKLLAEFDLVAARLEDEQIAKFGPRILFPGVHGMLNSLRSLGCRLYIASTGSPGHVKVTLDVSGIAPLFAQIRCGEPDKTDMVCQILHGLPLGEAILVGDRAKDADAARSNGIPSVGAAFGYCGPEERSLFDYIAETPAALVAFVKNWADTAGSVNNLRSTEE